MMYKIYNCITLLNSVKLLSTKLLKKNRMIQVTRVFSLPVYQSRLYCINLDSDVQPEKIDLRKTVSLKYILTTDFQQYLEKNPDEIDWDNARQYLLSISNARINSVNIDSIIVDLCFELQNLDAALSYLNFLKANNYEINLTMRVKQLKLYYLKKDSLTKIDKTKMLKTYDDIRKKYEQLPASIAEMCIMCVLLTYRWRESFEMLEDIKICNRPGKIIYNCIIETAFNNNKLKIGWKYFMEMLSMNIYPGDEVYTSYLNYCHRNQVSCFKVHMEKLFNVWHEHCIRITENVAEQYTRIHNELGFPAKLVNISDSGVCEFCKQKLGHVNIEEGDLEKIRQIIIKLLFNKDGPYCTTMPGVHKNFLRFVDDTKPYDVVIDALNIFYRTGKDPRFINAIIDRFTGNGKKVLIIGRYHLKKQILRNKQKDVYYFFVENDTVDDIYLLYAVISSGVNAKFVSDDLMRQHKSVLLDPELKKKFKVWQMTRQYTIAFDTKNVNIVEPPVYAMVAQKNNNSWHIPYVNSPNMDTYEIIKNWACITYPRDNY